MKIIGGTASSSIAEDLSNITKNSLVKTKIERFPDGELYVRLLEPVKNEKVIIIQTTYPDQNIIELFLLIDAAKKANSKEIITVIPYYGYARQDKQFKDGEPVSAQILAELISLKTDKIITIDPHKDHILDFFTPTAQKISAIPLICKYLKTKNIDLILAPDKGAVYTAQKASEDLSCEYDYLEKTRINGSTIKITPKNLDVKNKKVAIIDDIISTGGTMATAIKELKKQKASEVYVACTHGLFAGSAIEKLKSAKCDEIITTDTIFSKYSKVKTAEIIADVL
jgi:ribose-phosphate pyrophosphokinase